MVLSGFSFKVNLAILNLQHAPYGVLLTLAPTYPPTHPPTLWLLSTPHELSPLQSLRQRLRAQARLLVSGQPPLLSDV